MITGQPQAQPLEVFPREIVEREHLQACLNRRSYVLRHHERVQPAKRAVPAGWITWLATRGGLLT